MNLGKAQLCKYVAHVYPIQFVIKNVSLHFLLSCFHKHVGAIPPLQLHPSNPLCLGDGNSTDRELTGD